MAEATTTDLLARPADPADRADPSERGRLSVADRALQKIVTAAALEVDGVAPGGSGGLGRLFGSGYPSVVLEHAGSRVRVEVDVASVWPHPAARVAADVRTAVARRLDELAAVSADAVSVTVRDVVRPVHVRKGARVR